jgi:hypothetical protein
MCRHRWRHRWRLRKDVVAACAARPLLRLWLDDQRRRPQSLAVSPVGHTFILLLCLVTGLLLRTFLSLTFLGVLYVPADLGLSLVDVRLLRLLSFLTNFNLR